jgi:hypothetical protein
MSSIIEPIWHPLFQFSEMRRCRRDLHRMLGARVQTLKRSSALKRCAMLMMQCAPVQDLTVRSDPSDGQDHSSQQKPRLQSRRSLEGRPGTTPWSGEGTLRGVAQEVAHTRAGKRDILRESIKMESEIAKVLQCKLLQYGRLLWDVSSMRSEQRAVCNKLM